MLHEKVPTARDKNFRPSVQSFIKHKESCASPCKKCLAANIVRTHRGVLRYCTWKAWLNCDLPRDLRCLAFGHQSLHLIIADHCVHSKVHMNWVWRWFTCVPWALQHSAMGGEQLVPTWSTISEETRSRLLASSKQNTETALHCREY